MPALRAFAHLRCAALAALIFASAQTAFAQQQPPQLVESVVVVGNRRLTREEIFRHIKTRPGEPYGPEQVQRDLQTLAGLGVFDPRSLRVSTALGPRGGVEVSFVVWELPLVESVRIEGLRAGDEWQLRDVLRRKGMEVRAGGVLDGDKLTKAVAEMERLLRGRGWHNVVVETRTEQVSATSVRLTFVVRGLPPKKRLDRKKSDRLGRQDAVA